MLERPKPSQPDQKEPTIEFTPEDLIGRFQEMLAGPHRTEDERKEIQAAIDNLQKTLKEKGE